MYKCPWETRGHERQCAGASGKLLRSLKLGNVQLIRDDHKDFLSLAAEPACRSGDLGFDPGFQKQQPVVMIEFLHVTLTPTTCFHMDPGVDHPWRSDEQLLAFIQK